MREITYLAIIIPITATLGFWHLLNYLQEHQSTIRSWVPQAFWIGVCLVIVITPTLATTYYDPTISGEDYVIVGTGMAGAERRSFRKCSGLVIAPGLALHEYEYRRTRREPGNRDEKIPQSAAEYLFQSRRLGRVHKGVPEGLWCTVYNQF